MCSVSSLVAAACEDRSLHLYSSTTGRRLCPSIVLDSSPSYLCCAALYVMVITSRAAAYVWFVKCILLPNLTIDFSLTLLFVNLREYNCSGQGLCLLDRIQLLWAGLMLIRENTVVVGRTCVY